MEKRSALLQQQDQSIPAGWQGKVKPPFHLLPLRGIEHPVRPEVSLPGFDEKKTMVLRDPGGYIKMACLNSRMVSNCAMSFSSLPLSYCTNVHPGLSIEAVLHGLSELSAPIASGYGQPLAAGLWLARPVIDELLTDDEHRHALFVRLRDLGLECYTLNAFPFGDFHSDRVKEQVYLPDWTQTSRREYTLACASILSKLLPDHVEGSISTVPLGFKSLATEPDFLDQCRFHLIRTAIGLAELRRKSRRMVRLALEPEPCCVLETTPETIEFIQSLRQACGSEVERKAVTEHIGVCFDVCHQSVEYENVAKSIRKLAEAEIRINKVHITNAIELPDPANNVEGRAALAKYAEPRYLHQTFAKVGKRKLVRRIDLDRELCENPSERFRGAESWRVHFHVPVDRETLGPLATTRPDLVRALAAVQNLDYAPHLEVETYTWEVLPDGGATNLVDGFAQELRSTQQLLNELTVPREAAADAV